MPDTLFRKAIELRTHLRKIEQLSDKPIQSLYLSDEEVMAQLESACNTCIEMGKCYMKQQNWLVPELVPQVFDKLVDHQVIESSLSRRLLSMISFGRLLSHASQLKGKCCRVNLKSSQIEDMHLFTQKLLLS